MVLQKRVSKDRDTDLADKRMHFVEKFFGETVFAVPQSFEKSRGCGFLMPESNSE